MAAWRTRRVISVRFRHRAAGADRAVAGGRLTWAGAAGLLVRSFGHPQRTDRDWSRRTSAVWLLLPGGPLPQQPRSAGDVGRRRLRAVGDVAGRRLGAREARGQS
jgi:hypothetical protein